MRFRDRAEAGRRVAEELEGMGLEDPLVLALPRGGVPVGAEVARRLGASLSVFVARKIGAPGQPELGIGAIAEGGAVVVDARMLTVLGVESAHLDRVIATERAELDRRVAQYRGGRPLPDLEGRDVILVDDGLATGVTAEAALGAVRQLSPRRLVLAVPVAAPETIRRLTAPTAADLVVCPVQTDDLVAVGRWYEDFAQVTDAQVLALLSQADSGT